MSRKPMYKIVTRRLNSGGGGGWASGGRTDKFDWKKHYPHLKGEITNHPAPEGAGDIQNGSKGPDLKPQ